MSGKRSVRASASSDVAKSTKPSQKHNDGLRQTLTTKMDRTAQLDGSDSQERYRASSTQGQRMSVFQRQLGNAVLILDSLDTSSLDQLKEDKGVQDLVRHLLSIFETPQAPSNVASSSDQVATSGWGGVVSSFVRSLSLLGQSSQESNCDDVREIHPHVAPFSVRNLLPDGGQSLPTAVIAGLEKEATIHLLQGSYAKATSRTIHSIEKRLSRAEGCSYTVLQSNRHDGISAKSSGPSLSLTSYPATYSLCSMIQSTPLSDLWSSNAITRIREGGTVEYGLRIDDATTNALFELDPHMAQNGHQIYTNYLHSNFLDLGRVPSDDDIFASETVAAGMYMLSGDIVRLERLVADGEKGMEMIIRRMNPAGELRMDIYQSIIRPFRLQY